MKSKPMFRRGFARMGLTLILLMGMLSIAGCFGTSDSGATTKLQEDNSNWDEIVWDKDKWS